MRIIAPCLISTFAALLVGCGGSSQQATTPAQPEPPPRPAVSADWREVVPAGPQAVIGMNITRLSRSPLVEAVVETIAGQDPEVAETLDMLREVGARCKLDFSRDIHSVVVALYDIDGQPSSAAVVKGSFDEARIVDCATRMAERMNSALSTSEMSGYKVYSSPNPDTSGLACVPMANLMILTSNSTVMQTILAAESPRFGSERTELSALLFELPQDRSLWGASIIPASSEIIDYMQQATSNALSRRPRAIYGHAEIQDSIQGQGGLALGSSQDASLLLDWASTQMAALRPLLATQGMGALLDGLTLAAKGDRLTVSLSLSAEQIYKLMQMAP